MAVHDISLMGAVFPDVPKVVLPISGGGTATFTDVSDTDATASDVASGKYFYTADGTKTVGTASGGTAAISIEDTTDTAGGTIRTISALDISDTTAVAADVASGKYFYTADGTKTAGTASGGGSGLVYETGTWTPASDTSSVDISFTGTHSLLPLYVRLYDTSKTHPQAAGYNQFFSLSNFYATDDVWIAMMTESETKIYARCVWFYTTASSNSAGGVSITSLTGTTSNGCLPYWLTNSGFKAYTNTTNRYWKSGNTYKWIAVWK